MLLEKDPIDLELEFVHVFALLVVVHFYSEFVAVVSEVERNTEGLGKALGMPALLGFAIDV